MGILFLNIYQIVENFEDLSETGVFFIFIKIKGYIEIAVMLILLFKMLQILRKKRKIYKYLIA